jgi:hypothetical protein
VLVGGVAADATSCSGGAAVVATSADGVSGAVAAAEGSVLDAAEVPAPPGGEVAEGAALPSVSSTGTALMSVDSCRFLIHLHRWGAGRLRRRRAHWRWCGGRRCRHRSRCQRRSRPRRRSRRSRRAGLRLRRRPAALHGFTTIPAGLRTTGAGGGTGAGSGGGGTVRSGAEAHEASHAATAITAVRAWRTLNLRRELPAHPHPQPVAACAPDSAR